MKMQILNLRSSFKKLRVLPMSPSEANPWTKPTSTFQELWPPSSISIKPRLNKKREKQTHWHQLHGNSSTCHPGDSFRVIQHLRDWSQLSHLQWTSCHLDRRGCTSEGDQDLKIDSGQRQETKTRVQLEEELDSAIMDLTPKYKRKAAVKLEKFPHYRSMHPSPTLSLCNRFKSIVEKYLTLLITGYLEEIYYAGQKAWHLARRQLVVTLFGRLCISIFWQWWWNFKFFF